MNFYIRFVWSIPCCVPSKKIHITKHLFNCKNKQFLSVSVIQDGLQKKEKKKKSATRILTLFFLCVVVFPIYYNVSFHFVEHQFKGIHNFNVSTLLFSNEGAKNCKNSKIQLEPKSTSEILMWHSALRSC